MRAVGGTQAAIRSSYAAASAGSNESASDSTITRKNSPGCSSPNDRTTAAGSRSPRRIAFSASLHEILADNRFQLLNSGLGHERFVGDQRMLQRRTALAGSLGRHRFHRVRNYPAGMRGILLEHTDDVRHLHRVVFFMPAIVIGNHRDGHVA